MWQIVTLWHATPWAPLGLATAMVVAVAAARPLARRTGTSTFGAGAWLLSLGAVLGITLTPGRLPSSHSWCGLGFPDPVTPGELFAFHERGLNAWMLMPLAFVSALPRRRSTLVAAICVTVALPFVVEATQYAVPALGRVCQARDVGANLTGVAIGLAVGWGVRVVARRAAGSTSA